MLTLTKKNSFLWSKKLFNPKFMRYFKCKHCRWMLILLVCYYRLRVFLFKLYFPYKRRLFPSYLQKAMVQFQWHDGSVKNIHVDMSLLFEYQKQLYSTVRLYEKRIEWLACGSRRIFGTIVEKKLVCNIKSFTWYAVQHCVLFLAWSYLPGTKFDSKLQILVHTLWVNHSNITSMQVHVHGSYRAVSILLDCYCFGLILTIHVKLWHTSYWICHHFS